MGANFFLGWLIFLGGRGVLGLINGKNVFAFMS